MIRRISRREALRDLGALFAIPLIRWPDRLTDPLAGTIIEKVTLARFARSFSISLKSGMSMVQTLAVLSLVVDNAYIAQRIDQMRDGVERGESVLRTARAAGVFTPIVLQMMAVGEEAGELDDLMREVADMYQREIDYELKGLSANIEPIMITFLGVLVLILALGVFLPIWDLGRAANRLGAVLLAVFHPGRRVDS